MNSGAPSPRLPPQTHAPRPISTHSGLSSCVQTGPRGTNQRARPRPRRPALASHERGRAKTPRPANGGAAPGGGLRQWARRGGRSGRAGPQAAGFEPDVRGAGQSAAAARGPAPGPSVGPAPRRPAPSCACGRPRERDRDSGPAGGGGGRSHVGEHGRAAAPGHDQPVRAGGGLRGRPGAAAAAGGALAVRDGPQRVLPGQQHSQQPAPPPDDVHPQQHASHAAQLPRRPGHVLQASHLRGPAERQQPHDGRGLLAPCKLQPLLGLVPAQPPGRLDPPVVANGPQPPPPAPPTAHVAPGAQQGGAQQKAMAAVDGQR